MLQFCTDSNFAAVYCTGQYLSAGSSSADVQQLMYCNEEGLFYLELSGLQVVLFCK